MKVPSSRVVVGPRWGGAAYCRRSRMLHLRTESGSRQTLCGITVDYFRFRNGYRRFGEEWRRPRSGGEKLPLCQVCSRIERTMQTFDRRVTRAAAEAGIL